MPRVGRKRIAAHMHAGERPATPAIPLPASFSAHTFPPFLVEAEEKEELSLFLHKVELQFIFWEKLGLYAYSLGWEIERVSICSQRST